MLKLTTRLLMRDILRLAGVTIVLSALTASLVLSFALLPKAPILGGILTGTLSFLTLAVAGGFIYAFSIRHSPYLGYQHLNGVKLTSLTLVATSLPLLFSWIGVAVGVVSGHLLLTSPYLNTYAIFVKANAAAFNYATYQVTPVTAGAVSALLLSILGFALLSVAVTPNLIRKNATI